MADEIRLAVVADCQWLVRLNAEIQSLHADLEPCFFKSVADDASLTAYFTECIEKEDHEIALFCRDGEALGYVVIEYKPAKESAFTMASERVEVHQLCVTKSARRSGIASKLMRWVETRAKEMGKELVVLDFIATNEEAQAFYAAMGYAPLRVMNTKRL